MQERVLSKLIRYEIMIRKAVNGNFDGKFKSIFKGSGLEFNDLRSYTYGDDQRLIDWNASSKGHGIFVKLFREEKEQQVFLMVDVSGSQSIGNTGFAKIDLSRELAGTLAISAIKENSKVGLFCFTNQRELYLPPKTTDKHGYQLVTKLFDHQPKTQKTNIADALLFALQILKKKSVVILISDFLDQGYEHNLRALARKHDLIVLHIYDNREVNLPPLGILPVFDPEAGQIVWANTSLPSFHKKLKSNFTNNKAVLERVCKENKANYLAIGPTDNFVEQLVKLFKLRRKNN
jgi:uncharacterized protein (DUF58 family)